MGPPPLQDDLYYDVGKNQFVKIAPEIPAVDTSQTQEESPETVGQESETLEPEGQKNIIEFLYDIFQDAETQENNEQPFGPLQPLEPQS